MKTTALLLVLLCAADARAIIRRHDRDDARYRELARGHDAVVDMNLPGGAGTLIARVSSYVDWIAATMRSGDAACSAVPDFDRFEWEGVNVQVKNDS